MIDHTHLRRPITVPNPTDYSEKLEAARERLRAIGKAGAIDPTAPLLPTFSVPRHQAKVVGVARFGDRDAERRRLIDAMRERESLDARKTL
jgi:hypothetical protein